MRTKIKKRGFTLIELLVVISIIALLVAILMPALGKARKQARASVCSANLKQISMGLKYYADNNEDKVMALSHQAGEYWFHEIAPYLGDKAYKKNPAANIKGVMQVAFCPETRQPVKPGVASWYGNDRESWKWMEGEGGYGINCWFMTSGLYVDQMPQNRIFKTLTLANSQVPLFGDSVWVGSWPDNQDNVPDDVYGRGYGGGFPHQNGFFMGRFCLDRHGKSTVVAFADLHVEKINLEQLWALKWHRQSVPRYGIKINYGKK